MKNEITKLLESKGLTVLEDNAQWKNRFEIESETSNRVYIVAQNKNSGDFGCSCPAWRTRRTCKHLNVIQPLLSQIKSKQLTNG